MKNQPELSIHISCHDVPLPGPDEEGGLRLGIQKLQDVLDDVPLQAGGEAPAFTAVLRVGTQGRGGAPNFLGPYAFGPVSGRFLYLCWGRRKGGAWEPVGRVKIQLNHLTAWEVDEAVQSGAGLNVRVYLTRKGGKRVCGTITGDNVHWGESVRQGAL